MEQLAKLYHKVVFLIFHVGKPHGVCAIQLLKLKPDPLQQHKVVQEQLVETLVRAVSRISAVFSPHGRFVAQQQIPKPEQL